MFDTEQCKLSHKMMIRLNNFLYVFNLRQGTILIAVHQIAMTSFVLILLLVGIAHVDEMLSMLQTDMRDDAERHGFYEVYGPHPEFHEGDVVSTNNQRRFAAAQRLAHGTAMFFFWSTSMTLLYLMSCILLLYGAVRYAHAFMVPWILMAGAAVLLMFTMIVLGDTVPWVVSFFGGHCLYRFSGAILVLTSIYSICVVVSFAVELGASRCRHRSTVTSDERGERLLLLDHAAHSSLLSAAQYSKLSHGTRTQFV